jgi:glycerate kinase
MNILIAADSFKGCCTSREAAAGFKKGILRVFPHAQINIIPIADGGEGTVNAVLSARGGALKHVNVKGPLGDNVTAAFGLLSEKEAVIEMAAASGLTLVSKNDPMRATTYGTGQLIASALDAGCTYIYIGIGGSATNDGGAGMAQALGARFMDRNGDTVPLGGGSLRLIHSIDVSGMDKRLESAKLTVMSDVTNPLCGENGASAVFGPQKDASPEQVKLLDEGLKAFSQKVKEEMGVGCASAPGAGAAGGLGFGLMAFTGAKLCSGIATILDLSGFDVLAEKADIIITGEGSLDKRSIFGKAPAGVAKRAKKFGKPVIAIAGGIEKGSDKLYEYGIDAAISGICRPMSIQEAMAESGELVADAAETAMRLLDIGMGLKHRG